MKKFRLNFLQISLIRLLHFVRNDCHCEEERRSNLSFARSLFFQLFILATFTACSSSENSSLDTLKNDLKICPKCHMEIQKSGVYSATINENGHLKYFDDIGCMILWAKENKISLKTNATVFSSDTNKYIDATKANYKINDITPMSYGFSGYEIANKEYINFDEVVIKMLRGEHMGNPKMRQQLQNSKGLL